MYFRKCEKLFAPLTRVIFSLFYKKIEVAGGRHGVHNNVGLKKKKKTFKV